ncbi:hypothetical protein BLNAU_5024 [Blattamonas nauphoetae]|uniref:Protein kinase domain-containing protein n=1 Tax=Blattamonas nauphoetae TaxID=2049346 RepID=A0ABQ9Y8W1_9EUKA|nr:hypothetical protein BLNAU_5024 [Blattamonas nauphoetae]
MTLKGTTNTVILLSSQVHETVTNSSVSLESLHLNLLHDQTPQNTPPSSESAQNEVTPNTRCAVVESSALLVLGCTVTLSYSVAPFLLSTAAECQGISPSLTLIDTSISSNTVFVPPFSEMSASQPITEHATVAISSLSVSSVTLSESSGIACHLPTNTPLLTLSASITSCSFHNMSSVSSSFPTRSGACLHQLMAGNDLERVENALYGTVTAVLGHSHTFDCLNTTILECENPTRSTRTHSNAETQIKQDVVQDFTSDSGQFVTVAGITHYHFISCNITSSTQTKAFYMINIGQLEGTLKLFDCRFTINATGAHVMAVNIAGVKETPHSLLFDSCLFQYDKASTLVSADNQLSTKYSVMTTIVSSTFTSKNFNTSTRLLAIFDSQAFLQFSNSRFEHQFVTGGGSLFTHVNSVAHTRLFDCHFKNNAATGSGGLFYIEFTQFNAFRCVFEDSTSGARGGVLYSPNPVAFYLEECRFVNNKALEYDSANSSYTHFRGNDINIFANTLGLFTSETVVGCSSTSPTPRIAHYRTANANGGHPQDTLLLPDPVDVTLTKLFVEVGGSGADCTEVAPCSLFATALAKAGTLTEVLFGGGEHVESGSTITKSVRLIGKGWTTNTTLSTILTTSGMKVGTAGNLTLASLSLKPSSASTTLISHSTSDAKSWVSSVWIEGITAHTVPLFSFSQGTARFAMCTINSITLTQNAVFSLTGSASLTLRQVWFMHVTSQATTASCIYSTTSGLVDLRTSDYAYCSSKGPAGCLHISHTDQSKLILSDMLFRANTASPSISPNVSDMYLSYHPNAFSSTLRSMSAKPHALVAGKTYTFQFPGAGYHDHGIIHPNNMRFYWGIPMSQAGTVQDMVDRLLPNSRVDVRMVVGNETLTPIIVEEKEIGIYQAKFNINPILTTPSVTISTNGYVRFDTGTFYLTQGYKTTPFVVQVSSASMVIINTYMMMPATIYHPLVKSVGSLHLEGAYMEAQLAMDGCSVIETTGGKLQTCVQTFNNLSSNVDGSYLNAKNTEFTMFQVTFRNCSARNGGALYVDFSGSNSFMIYHYLNVDMFVGCSALEKGGAIFVKGTSNHLRPIQFNSSSLNHARFEGNTAQEGNDVYVEASLFEGKTPEQIPPFGGVSRSNEFRVEIEGRTDPEEKELIHFFLQTPTISVNGSVYEGALGYSGKDDDSCKWTGTHCATLKHGVQHLTQKYKNNTHFPQTIRFVWNMTYTERDVLVSDQDVTVAGTTASNAATAEIIRSIVDVDTAMSEGAFLFTIQNTARLVVTNLDIRPIEKCGLFDLKDDADSLQLDDVAIICAVGDTFEVPLIKSTSKPITIVGCQFHTSKGSSGSTMFSQPLISFSSTTSSLSISSTTFETFSISSTPLISIDTTQPITFITNTFKDVTRTPTVHLVRVASSSLKSVVLPSLWTGSFTPTQPLLDFVGRDSTLTSNHRFFESSLLFYLLRPTGSIVAGETAAHEESEHAECGTERLRCSSLNSALSSTIAHSIDAPISVAGTTLLLAALDVTTAASFSSKTGTQMVQQSATGSITMNAAAQTLSFSSLLFDLSPSSTISTLFTITAGTLALTSCSIGTDTPTELNVACTGLIDVASGTTLTLTSSTIQNLKFTHPTLGTAINLQIDSSFSSDVGTIFSSVTSNATGSLIFIHSADLDTTLKTSPFSLLKSTIQLPIDTLFTDEDKKLFVGQVGSQSPESLLYFWFPHTATETTLSVDGNGEDHPNCGLSQLPCKTLENGFASLKTTGTTLVLNKADTITTTLTAKFAAQKIQSKTTEQTVTVPSSGTLSVSSTLKLTLHTLAFSFESGTRIAPFVKVTAGSLIVEQCSFGSKLTNTVLTSALFDVKGSLTVDSVTFTRLQTSQAAGLFNLALVDADSLSFKTTRIEGCASSAAPLISLSLSSTAQQTNWNFDLSGISFLQATSNAAPSGALIFVSGSSFETQIVPSRFPQINPDTDENNFWGFDSSTNVDSSLLVYLVQPGSTVFVDGTNGKEIEHCGHFGVSCLTIEKGIARATATDSAKQIHLQDKTSLSKTISPTSLALTIAGETQKRQIPIVGGGQFVVPDGSLILHSLIFTTSVETFSNSLVTVTSAGSFFVTSCTFTSFSSASAASILTATVGASQSVQISDTTFTQCNSTGTVRSGVLDVSMVEGSDFSVTHTPNPFDTFTDILQFSWDQTMPTYRDFVGKEGSHSIPVPLSLYFLTLPPSTFISADSNDASVCGFTEYPCASLTALHDRIKETADMTITFNTDLEHSTELAFSNSVTISGNEKTMTIKETSATATNTALFSLTANTQITALFVSVPSNFKHASVFHPLSDSLSIQNCSFTQSGAGSIVGSLIQIDSGANLTLHTTFFVSISSASEKAGVIVADISESASFLLNNNTFASCSCAGQAHSIFIALENKTEVTSSSFDYEMKNLVFSTSTSNSNAEKQINVFLTGNRIDLTTKSGDWEGSYSTDSPESLWGYDTSTGMNTSLLPYLVALEGTVEVDDKGYNFEKCGHYYLYCKTLSLGITRMGSSHTINTIKVIDSIEVDSNVTLKGTNSVVGDKKASTLTFTENVLFENKVQDDVDSFLTLRTLTISIPATSSHDALFTSSSGLLKFDDCSFVAPASSELTFSLISATGGTLELSSVTAERFTLTSTPLIVSSAPVTITSSSFSSITLESDPLILSEGSISISQSNFTSINRVTGLGCVLEAQKSENGPVKVIDTSFTSYTSSNRPTWILLNDTHDTTKLSDSWEGTFNNSVHRHSVLVQLPSSSFAMSTSNSVDTTPFSLIYLFHPCTDGPITVEEGEFQEDHERCGNESAPCKTLDGGVTKTKHHHAQIKGISSLNTPLLLSGAYLEVEGRRGTGKLQLKGKGQFVNNENVDPDHLTLSLLTLDLSASTLTDEESVIVNDNGDVKLESVVVVSSLTIQPSLVCLSGGSGTVKNLTLSSLTFSSPLLALSSFQSVYLIDIKPIDTSFSSFVTAANGELLSIQNCSFAGSVDTGAESELENSETDICDWSDALISLTNTTTTIFHSSFTNLEMGAISVSGESLKLEESSFSSNFASNSSFPSFRRNIRCSSTHVNITSIVTGDGTASSPSAWINIGEDCKLHTQVFSPHSALFVPILTGNKSKVEFNKKTNLYAMTLSGQLLIPCGLSMEVFEWNDKTKTETGKTHLVDFSQVIPSSWNETQLVLSLPHTSLTPSLNTTFEWKARIAYGDDQVTDESVTVKVSAVAERKALTKQAMQWIIPVVASVAGLLLLLLIIILVCRRRKQKKEKENKQELLANQELNLAVEVKYDEDPTVHMMGDRENNNFSSVTHISTKNEALEKDVDFEEKAAPSEAFLPADMCEAIACADNTDIRMMDKRNTLYERIHKQEGNNALLRRFHIQFQIVQGLKQMGQSNNFKEVLLRLNPHNIILTGDDDVFLKLKDEDNKSHSYFRRPQSVEETTPKNNAHQRWIAPEVMNAQNQTNKPVDGTSASVFSLGLILWEMETGNVPLGEVDGVNAQRQLSTGSRPKMEGLSNDMKELIEQCLDLNPSLRPSLATIQEKLIGIGVSTGQLTSQEMGGFMQKLESKQRQVPMH